MKKNHRSPYTLFILIAFGLTIFFYYFLLIYVTKLSSYLIAININTFLLYAYDKFISSRSGLRVPENILHILALLGGSPSALLAQHLFRHKVSKPGFQWVFWITVFLQAALLYYLISEGHL